jgi:diadenosine tetraphosphatase ApaH/serine/threonine PP2A family protein phosphatase
MSAPRTLFIGDVHGCSAELEELLDRLQPRPGVDRVIFIGDLINKGPDSAGVWRRYRALGAESVMGNHELRLLEMATGRWPPGGLLARMQQEFGPDFPAFVAELKSWPYLIETPDFLAVHAGFRPDRPPAETPTQELVTLRLWERTGRASLTGDDPPWFEHYHGEKLVVFGHWAALGGIVRPNAIGLDTGCVYGGSLTALELPSRTLVQVKARRAYRAVV